MDFPYQTDITNDMYSQTELYVSHVHFIHVYDIESD